MESWYQHPVQYTNSFSLHTLILFCNLRIWGHMWLFLNNGPHLLAVAIKTLFSTIKLVMRTSAMKILNVNGSFCGTKSMLSILCCCRSDEALSLCVLVNIYRFTSASPWWAQLLYSRKQTTHKKFESLKSSLDICYIIWNQILYYLQQLRWAVRAAFCRTVCFICSWRFVLFNLLLRYPYTFFVYV